jgi:hypothetical protein
MHALAGVVWVLLIACRSGTTATPPCDTDQGCPGAQRCYCDPDTSVDNRCLDHDDRPSGQCLSRREAAEREVAWEAAFCARSGKSSDCVRTGKATEHSAASVVRAAEDMAKKAMQEAEAAQTTLEQMSRDVDELNGKLTSATNAVMEAQSDAARTAAQALLDRVRSERLVLERRIEAAKAEAAKAERAKGVHLSKECLENPLAKGCS